MKTFLLAALLACASTLYAQPACTTITGPVYQLGSTTLTTLVDGSYIDVSLAYSPVTGPTQSVARITTVSGNFSICLAPASYTATYGVKKPSPLTGTTTYTRTWTVPSGGPYTVQAIEGTNPVTPLTIVGLSQISQSGATNGQAPVWSTASGAWLPSTIASGGGTWGSITGTLSAQTDLQTALNGKQATLGFTPLNPANNLSEVTAATARTNLGLGTAATQATSAFEVPLTFGAGLNRATNTITVPALGITNGMLAGSIAFTKLVGSDVSIANTQVSGLGTASTHASTDFDASGAASTAQAAAIAASAQRASNLSDLASASTARTNLGLGSLATLSALPNPSASTLGGVESIAAVSHQFVTTISTAGVPALAQPAYTDISGTPTIPTIATTSTPLVGDGAGNAVASTPTGTGNPVLATSPTLVTPNLGVATATKYTSSTNATASTPPWSLTGTWFTSGGTATTTKPQALVECNSGTTVTTAWSTAGTGLGVNACTGFTGRLLDLQLNGVSQLNVSSAGVLAFNGAVSSSGGAAFASYQFTGGNGVFAETAVNDTGTAMESLLVSSGAPRQVIGSSFCAAPGTTFPAVACGVQAQGNGNLLATNTVLKLGGMAECTHGANGTCGVATLASGTVTISTTAIAALAASGAAGDYVRLTLQNCSSCGAVSIGTVTAATSFVINSTNASDASLVFWQIGVVN